MRLGHLLSYVLLPLLLACDQAPEEKTTKKKVDDISVLGALPLKAPFPKDNPFSEPKAQLGKLLFFDPILSGNKDVACATCHHPEFGFAESLEVSIGVNGLGLGSRRKFRLPNDIPLVKRNSQTILNTAFNGLKNKKTYHPDVAPMFWDLRAESLEMQALEPLKAFEEMRGHGFSEENIIPESVRRIKTIPEYRKLFKDAFPISPEISEQTLAKAIATYERTLIANNTRFDQYMRGDQTALSANELLGLNAFLKSGCTKCHNGPMFSDFEPHALAVIDNERLGYSDTGLDSTYAFRTPSLRNLRFTAPYMHSGKIRTLKQVLEFYEDLSGGKLKNPQVRPNQLDPLIHDLNVNFKDISLIVEFLNTLNDQDFDKSMPEKVPSGLPVGGDI
ncbi:MAG: cytochrome c peroxidase [Arcticibacterium sp.]|jgi:cytochrome c peroxidase